MRIHLDIQAAVAQKAGVGQYTWYLAQYLPGLIDPDDVISLFCFDFQRRAYRLSELPPGLPLTQCRWMPGRVVQYGWKRFGFPPYHWFAGRADVYHFPNFIIPPGVPGPAVVTVHDLAFVRYPEFTERGNLAYLGAHLPRTLRRADHVLTDSEFSRRELIDVYDVPPERVTAVLLAVDEPFRRIHDPDTIEEFRRRAGLPARYLLTVGTLEPRKNLSGLVRAYRVFRERYPDLRDVSLAVAGARGWKDDEILAELNAPDLAESIHWVGYVEHDDLPLLYQASTAFVFPSFYEGFGMPPAEAMAGGVPTICSHAASLPEVVGDAALLVDPASTDEIADAMRRIVADDDLRDRLRRDGPRRVEPFTWERTARNALDIYRAAAAGETGR